MKEITSLNSISVTLVSEKGENGKIYWHIWNAEGETIKPAFEYLIDLVDDMNYDKSTVETYAYAIKKWYFFLSTQNTIDVDVSDVLLIQFRDNLLNSASPNAGTDERARKRTVNNSIRAIYRYYYWLQDQPVYALGRRFVGPTKDYAIQSTIGQHGTDRAQRTARTDYPIAYHNVGETSRHRDTHSLTESNRSSMHEYFHAHHGSAIAVRNALIVDLVWDVGLRRDSVLSLKTSDFDVAKSHPELDYIEICPQSQKFGYSFKFPVPRHLAIRILNFIDNERSTIAKKTNSKSDDLFISSRTGERLNANGVSVLINRTAHAIGLPPRSGLHSGRHSFAERFLYRELAARRELNLDTSPESVSLALAEALGQENVNSQRAYLRNMTSILRQSSSFKYAMENASLASENAELRAQIRQLTTILQRRHKPTDP